jgi:hypothetical protein
MTDDLSNDQILYHFCGGGFMAADTAALFFASHWSKV